ncbi:hypothetical protein [Corynebacterium tapiri]|uniref:Uncharacterized protein n=1 Tax=Corynebacterium tapiri TaxID=1448266 RepID=A0A5C4U2S8_9CORY|nr:hypothetical protein [Corynebacterium tapiri]TNL94357.1 hypothetical protein FHE74_10485 [Corynebacterium tapiri]
MRSLMLKRASGVRVLSRHVTVRRVGLSGSVVLRVVQQPAVIGVRVLMIKSWNKRAPRQRSRLMLMTRRRVLQLNFCAPSHAAFVREVARS